MGKKKEKMMEDYLAQEWCVGDECTIKKGLLDTYTRNPEGIAYVTITKILPDNKVEIIEKTDERWKIEPKIFDRSVIKRSLFDVGANPFPEKAWNRRIRIHNNTLEGIIHVVGGSTYGKEAKITLKSGYSINGVEALECNFNPYVIKDGEKLYYQRDFCWTLKDKQLFIESIYQSINCGMILIRKRSFDYVDEELKKGNTEVGFSDIVDGKQRLGCLIDFIQDKFQDMHGNYYSDLSDHAKWYFRDSQCLTYAEMEEGTTDEDVIEAFLHVNFTGVPMSKEHIEYVKEIQNKLTK